MKKVGISDSGIASAAMTVARQSRRKRKTTMAARIMPSISTSCVAWKFALVSSVIEKILVIFSPGCASSRCLMAAKGALLDVDFGGGVDLDDVEARNGPAIEAGEGADFGGTIADVGHVREAHIGRAPAQRDGRSRSSSTVRVSPMTRVVVSEPPTSARPPP